MKYFEVSQQTLSTKPFVYSSLDADKWVSGYNNQLIQNSYIISLGSGGLEKVLSMDKIFNLIVHIKQNYNLIPSVVLNPGQEFLQDELIEKFLIPNKIEYNKLKLLSIEEIVSLMKLSKFIIVPDTGIYHIAVALSLPVFTVFTYTHPLLVEPDSGIFKLVFKESDKINFFDGLHFGTKDIEEKYLKEEFDNFYNMLEKK